MIFFIILNKLILVLSEKIIFFQKISGQHCILFHENQIKTVLFYLFQKYRTFFHYFFLCKIQRIVSHDLSLYRMKINFKIKFGFLYFYALQSD